MVCRSVCYTGDPAKTFEPIKMPFGLRTLVGPGNHVSERGPDLPTKRGNCFGGKGRHIVKYRDTLRSSVQKWLNRSRCRLGSGLRLAQRIMCSMGSTGSKGRCHGSNCCLSIYGVYNGATWQIWLNHTCAAAMRPYANYSDNLFRSLCMTLKLYANQAANVPKSYTSQECLTFHFC